MYLYFIFIILFCFAAGECLNISLRKFPPLYKVSFWFAILILIMLSTFRWENGTDWDTYYSFFRYLDTPTLLSYMEPGFTLLSSINSSYTNYTFHLGCMAVLSIMPIARKAYRVSPYPLLSLFVWFAISLANIFPVRQSVAIAIFVFSWTYIDKRQVYKYLLCVLLAMTFHYSAIITIPVYFIWHKHISKKMLLLSIVAVSIVVVISQDFIMNMLSNIGGVFAKKIEFYSNKGDESFGSIYSPREVLIRGIINRSFFFVFAVLLFDKLRSKYQYLNGAINMYWYSMLLFLTTTPISVALARLTMYTDVSQIIIVPFVFKLRMPLTSKILILVIIGLYFFMRFRGVVNNYYDLYVPYHFVFGAKL